MSLQNSFIAAAEEQPGTFGISVDAAPHTLMRRFIQSRQLPPAADVRLEEFINFFSYD